jgi:hypothetical protein
VRAQAPKSAEVLEKTLARERGPLTVADAAAKAGLPLRDAEEGLRYLAAEFSGHLAATTKGELLYSFPQGLVRPPETRLLRRFGRGLVKAVAGIGRFIVRAWVSVVLIGYALAFLALLIALAARSDREEGPGPAIGLVLRVIAEALFWTFHPFSPVYLRHEPNWLQPGLGGRRAKQPKIPFYEKVNRFVFGPPKVERDPREQERLVLAEVRRQKGRVAPADVMRVTGLDREEAERVLLRLVVDYQGDIEATDEGAVVYRFKDLRTTAAADRNQPVPQPIWGQQVTLPALTGNTGGSNFLFVLINGFNLAASGYVLANGLTIERLTHLLSQMGERFPQPMPPVDGIPLVLGAVPFVFSAALFLLPILRSLRRPAERKRVERENGWRGVLRVVLTGRKGRIDLTGAELRQAWMTASGGKSPTDKDLETAVRAAGGEVELNDQGEVVYRFEVLERELQATDSDRQGASADEASAGQVVFSSEDEGPGIREEEGDTPARTAGPAAGGFSSRRGFGTPSGPARPDRRTWTPTGDDPPVRSTRDPRSAPSQSTPDAPRALPEVPDTIPDRETAEELLARLGVDTRRRGR